jgi:hypothetical protein
MKMIYLEKGPFLLFIIQVAIFFYLPVNGIANDLPDESNDAIETEIYSAFYSLNEAEMLIIQSDSITEKQLIENFPEIKIETKKEPWFWVNLNSGNQVWKVPSFYWGCFFGPFGLLLTGIISKWKDDYLTDSLAGMVVNCIGINVAFVVYVFYVFIDLLIQLSN